MRGKYQADKLALCCDITNAELQVTPRYIFCSESLHLIIP